MFCKKCQKDMRKRDYVDSELGRLYVCSCGRARFDHEEAAQQGRAGDGWKATGNVETKEGEAQRNQKESRENKVFLRMV